MNPQPGNSQITSHAQPSVTIGPGATHEFITAELDAIRRGELRSQKQIEAFYEILSTADLTPHQRAESERLGLGMLVGKTEILTTTPSLVIKIASDLSELKYGELKEDISPKDLNPQDRQGRLFAADLDVQWLVTIPNPSLVTPGFGALMRYATPEAGTRVMQMMGFNERLTYFGDVPATWNGGLDSKVWSTNIDTVHFVKWLRDAGVFKGDIVRSAEIGVGIGGISQGLLSDNPFILDHVYTDISPHALNATRRNLLPYCSEENMSWYLGKGVRSLGERGHYDLIITNPPYIPHPDGQDAVDPYCGTGLIRELFEVGPSLLNPTNPDAAIYVQVSNLSMVDVERYRKEFPEIKVTLVGGPVEVPLKIWRVSRETDWVEYLKSLGLIEKPALAQTTGERWYHQISALKLQRA